MPAATYSEAAYCCEEEEAGRSGTRRCYDDSFSSVSALRGASVVHVLAQEEGDDLERAHGRFPPGVFVLDILLY